MALQDDWLAAYGNKPLVARDGPPHRSCASIAINYALMERHPVFRTLLSDLERETAARGPVPLGLVAEAPVTIPVVVHILWHDPAENIDGAQVAGQIAVLNADFAASNPDAARVPEVWEGLVGDSGIRFALATRDPDGNPHSGITRTETDVMEFGADDSMKSPDTGGAAAWPADRYLNIWVCNLAEILGYAQFPGGPPATDGVVIGHRCFGTGGTAVDPFNLGRTTTHEVGHWLNLRHIWGDTEDCSGSDFVDDTPGARLPNFGKPAFPSISCGNGPDGDMFMNYMDYVDDAAMFLFTAGQVARMQAALRTIRAGLLTSDGIG